MLMAAFIAETLRQTGPAQRLFRIAPRAIEIGAQRIKAGHWMALFLRPPSTIRRYFQRPIRSVWTARIGDVAAIIELLDDDILIEFYGPPVIPYAGTYRGAGQARRFF